MSDATSSGRRALSSTDGLAVNCDIVRLSLSVCLSVRSLNGSKPVEIYTVSQKNDNDVLHYNFNAHQPILIIFGRDIAE